MLGDSGTLYLDSGTDAKGCVDGTVGGGDSGPCLDSWRLFNVDGAGEIARASEWQSSQCFR